MGIRHAKVPSIPDDPSYEVGSDEWMADHIGTFPASSVTFTPTGTLSSTDVQAAIAEAATEAAGSLTVKDEGVSQGSANVLDFVGTGVSATVAAGTATITSQSPFGPQTLTVGPVGSGAQYTSIQVAVDAIPDASATKPYTIYHIGGVITMGSASGDECRMDGTSGTKKYIDLVGIDRDACIISRPASPGVGNGVFVASDHGGFFNLTIDSPVSRLIHWDRVAAAYLAVENCYLRQGGNGVGLSCGITGAGSICDVRNNLLNVGISWHNGNGAATDFGTVSVSGNTFLPLAADAIGFDISGGQSSILAYVMGNNGRFWEVDASHTIDIVLTDGTAPKLNLYTDGSPGLMFKNASAATKFWNWIIYPQVHRYSAASAITEAAIAVITPGLPTAGAQAIATTTSSDAAWPAVVIEPAPGAANSARVATGPFAEVICTTAAVNLGDPLVTSATAGQAKSNTGQTDPTKILGWAYTAKGAGSTGRVTVKLNQSINKW